MQVIHDTVLRYLFSLWQWLVLLERNSEIVEYCDENNLELNVLETKELIVEVTNKV